MSTHCAAELRPLDTMRQLSHFRNRRCLARCRRRLGRAFALKPAEEAPSITFQIGGRGSRHRSPLQDRPPTLQAFRSVLSRTTSVSTQRLFKGSRSYPRCHGVQSRGAVKLYQNHLSHIKPPLRINSDPRTNSWRGNVFVDPQFANCGLCDLRLHANIVATLQDSPPCPFEKRQA